MSDIQKVAEYPEEQFMEWLNSMAPFLRAGSSLNYSLIQAGLSQHKNTLYRKYDENDWFREKVSSLQSEPGEKVNKIYYNLVCAIETRIANGQPVSDQDVKVLNHYSEHHRSAQPFFVNRSEVAQVRPIAEVMAALDTNPDDARKRMAKELKEQSVEAATPIQDQGQNGSDSNVQTKPNSA